MAHLAPAITRGRGGFTLVELMIVLAIIATMAAMVVPRYRRAIEKAEEVVVEDELEAIQNLIDFYENEHGALPPSLDVLDGAPFVDPWGNPYQYLDFSQAKGNLQPRKDKFLHPLNSTYDLYSMGPDGESKTPLTAKASRDDIIRANDGDYIGVAELY